MNLISSPLIFVVEDDPMYLRIIEKKLHDFKNLKLFLSGEECIDNLHLKPDIVILDYDLGTIKGDDVLKEIKSVNRKTKVVFLTKKKEFSLANKVVNLGADGYIVKNTKSFEKIQRVINIFTKFYRLKAIKKILTILLIIALIIIGLFLLI